MKIRGTREWAVANIDCCTGCSHGCRYCYARYDAVVKNKSASGEEWNTPVIRHHDIDRDFPKYPGQVMFPTTHDIDPVNLQACLQVIANLLDSGNMVLVVSKPHLHCIKQLCQRFADDKDRILLRFTITAKDKSILSFWEPGAPGYQERLESLKYARIMEFQTSVSIEPMLQSEDVVELVGELAPFVTHSIWLGKMNRIDKRVVCDTKEMERELARIRRGQTDGEILHIYRRLKNNPLVRWKESIKEIVGIEPPDEAGLDI